jgi:hypothetical protein
MVFYWPPSNKVALQLGELSDENNTYGAGAQVAQLLAQAMGYPGLSATAAMDQIRALIGSATASTAVDGPFITPSGDATGATDVTNFTNWVNAINGASSAISPYIDGGQFFINAPIPQITKSGITIRGAGWAQSANTAGSCITATAGFSGSQMMSVSGEAVQMTAFTLDSGNHAATCLALTGIRAMLHRMQVRAGPSSGIGIDVQSGAASAYLDTVNINMVNGGTGLQVNDTDLIMTNCKPQNATVDVVLLSGASGAVIANNHWTAGSGKQNCVQVNGSASHIGFFNNRFDNYVFSAIQLTPSSSTPNNIMICNNIFHSTLITDATYAVIGVDTTSFGIRGLQIVGNAGYATGTNRPLYGLAAQTQAGSAATNQTRLSTLGTLFNSNNFWASSAMFGPSSSPTVARGNILTTDGTTYAAVTDI